MSPAGVTLRRIGEEDREFLRRLYASTRDDELARVIDWSAEQKQAFLSQQFAAQEAHYRRYYADASFDLVLEHDEPIGRLYVSRGQREIAVVDVALLPQARGRGIGTALLREVLAEAERDGKAVSIHVERFNRARALYRRLGFREVADDGPYIEMEWRSPLT